MVYTMIVCGMSVMWKSGVSETKEMKLSEWLELSRKWREMNKEMNKTPNVITDLPLQFVDLSLKHLDLVFLKSNPNFSILFPLFQRLEMMDQLPLLVTVLLHLHCQGFLSFLTTVCMIVQGGKLLVDTTEHVGNLLLGIMERLFQGVTLKELVRGTLNQVTLQVPSFPTPEFEVTSESQMLLPNTLQELQQELRRFSPSSRRFPSLEDCRGQDRSGCLSIPPEALQRHDTYAVGSWSVLVKYN